MVYIDIYEVYNNYIYIIYIYIIYVLWHIVCIINICASIYSMDLLYVRNTPDHELVVGFDPTRDNHDCPGLRCSVTHSLHHESTHNNA